MAAEVDFQNADDLRGEIARLIRENNVKFGHLNAQMFVLRRRVSETPAKWIARISLVPKRFKDVFGEAVYILEVDQANFDSLDPQQKEAVLFHELCHTFLTEKGTYKLVKHDIQEFLAVIEKYGGYLPDTVRLVNIVKGQLEVNKKEKENKENVETTPVSFENLKVDSFPFHSNPS